MNRRIFILILIILFGFILRLWDVAKIPPGLNRDEASIGYTSYSILETGKDEYGTILPLSFKSFGDWKLPLYIYLNIFSTKFLGLNEFSVRLPSVILGTLTILILYLLAKEIFRDYKYKESISIISSFLLSISPWHLHFSRVASEANLSVFLIVSGLLLFFKGLSLPILFPFSSIVLAFSLYSYHGSHLFTPIIFVGLLSILYFKKRDRNYIFLFIVPFLVLSLIIYQKTILSADKTKFSGLSYLSDKYLVYERISLSRLDHLYQSPLVSQVLHNKLTFIIGRFTENYLKSFSPEFLFLKGGGNLQHNIPNFGNLYIWELPFILGGLFFLFQKKMRWRYFLLFWLLSSPIPAAITRDAPHSARMLSILPLPHILSALGFIELITALRNKTAKYAILGIIFILIINFVVYLDRYFIHFPKAAEADWGGGYKDLVASVSRIADNYSQIVMDRPDYSPYIYFLFYQKADPVLFQKEAIHYPLDSEGFQHVASFKKLAFKKLDWASDLLIPGRLLITWAQSTPANATAAAILVDKPVLNELDKRFGQSFGLKVGDKILNKLIKVIRLKNGQSQFYLIEVKYE